MAGIPPVRLIERLREECLQALNDGGAHSRAHLHTKVREIEIVAAALQRAVEDLVAERSYYRTKWEAARRVLEEQGVRLLVCGEADFRCGSCAECREKNTAPSTE